MNNEFNISKIFVSNTAPTNVAKGKLWLDTSVSPSQLKESDGTNWINCGSTITIDNITLPVESVIESIGVELEGKADKSALNNYLPLTGGEISTNNSNSVIIQNSTAGLIAPLNVGLLVKDTYDTGQDTVILQTHYGANAITGNAVTDSITSGSYKLLTSGGAYTALQSKANDSEVVHLTGNEKITGTKEFVDNIASPNNKTVINQSNVSVTGSGYTTSMDYQGINFNTGRLEGVLSDLTNKSNTTVLNSQATYNELELKQDKTDDTLITGSKTIVGAINELVGQDLSINDVLIEHDNTLIIHTDQIAMAEEAITSINTKLLADVPAPITNVFTSTSTSLTSIITDSTKANIQGKILISPNINNLGAVYVGQSVTDKSTAFPLYPNQIVSFSFTDVTNFKVATDVIGDSFNYVIEFGILNAAVTPAEGLIIVGTDGSKYRLNPSGDTGSETFTLTKIS